MFPVRSSCEHANGLAIAFVLAFALVGAAPAASQEDGSRGEEGSSGVTFRRVAQDYANAMIERGRDHYGPEDSPLFAAMLNRRSLSLIGASERSLPEINGVRPKDRAWGAANPTHHQQLYELLYLLTDQTGRERYKQAADEALTYFFQRTQHPRTGFIAWGEHMGWGLKSDTVINSGAGVSQRMTLTHEMKQWDLWPRVYALAPQAAARFAQGLWRHQVRESGKFDRHAPYRQHDPGKGGDFPRYAGNMTVAWAHAYANAESETIRREVVTAIETVLGAYNEQRHPESDGIPLSWSSCQWDSWRCRQYHGKSVLQLVREGGRALTLPLPDSTKAMLDETVRRSDRVLKKLDHQPGGRGFLNRAHLETLKAGSGHRKRDASDAFTALWRQEQSSSFDPSSAYALWMLDRYEQTGDQEYRRLVLAAARAYLDSAPSRSKAIVPRALADAVTLMLRAYRLTGEMRFLERAATFGNMAGSMFMTETSPLPKATSKNDHYEAITGGDDLMLAFMNLHVALKKAGRNDLNSMKRAPVPFNLNGNHPNPFARTTTIKYWLPVKADVDVQVYNLLGRRVAALDEGTQARGHHEVVFEAGRLSSGVYVYRLTAGTQSATGKMVVVR